MPELWQGGGGSCLLFSPILLYLSSLAQELEVQPSLGILRAPLAPSVNAGRGNDGSASS